MVNQEKTILFFGYYDDFSHFFAKVAQRLLADMPQVVPVFASGFISGWLAWGRYARGRDRIFITLRLFILTQWYRLRYFRRIPPSAFRGYRPKSILRYDFLSTGRYSNLHALLARIHIFESIFEAYKPSYLVVSGDSRVSARVCIAAANKYGCKIGYFEQGPFGTSFLDPHGVNANLTVPVFCENFTKKNTVQEIPPRFSKVEKRNPFFRLSDYVLSYLPGWPEEFQSRFVGMRVNLNKKLKDSSVFQVTSPAREFLFALQVPDDANFILHSDFSDFETVLRLIAVALPDDAVLAVREHPKYIGSYDAGLYEVIAQSPQLYLQRDMSVTQALERCEGVITINSMMGLESVLADRPVFLLGRSYYSMLCETPDRLHCSFFALRDFLCAPPSIDHDKVKIFWKVFIKDVAISGHFRDAGVEAATRFADMIKVKM